MIDGVGDDEGERDQDERGGGEEQRPSVDEHDGEDDHRRDHEVKRLPKHAVVENLNEQKQPDKSFAFVFPS
jgi:hypothetical protein